MISKKETLIALITLAVVLALLAFDVHATHFEDGSGRITYCAPWALCAK